MEADIRRLTKRRDEDDSEDETTKKKAKKSYLQQELDKYAEARRSNRKGKRKDEGDVLAALNSFRGKLKNNTSGADAEAVSESNKAVENGDEGDQETKPVGQGEDVGMEVDDDRGFMNHALHFPKDDGEETRKAERDYEVIDPRQRGAKAKEEERERKRQMKARGGGGGRHRR